MTSHRIAYFVGAFPTISETFVLNEIVHLRRLGLDIIPISMSCSEDVPQTMHADGHAMQALTVYVRDEDLPDVTSAVLWALSSRPARFARMVHEALCLPIVPNASRVGRLMRSVLCARHVHRLHIAHIHAHWTLPADIAYLVSRFMDVPYSFTCHAHELYVHYSHYESRGFGLAERIRSARFCLTCVEHNRKVIQERVGPELESKVVNVYHGLDVQKFSRKQSKQLSDRQQPHILGVGRLTRDKSFHLLIDACKLLADEGVAFTCTIAGDGSQRTALEKQVRDLGLESCIKMPGAVTQEDLVELYESASVVVFPSKPDREWGVGNVIIEALAMEVPVIASPRPQIADFLIHEETGLLVPYGDAEILARSLMRLLKDPQLRNRLGRLGREAIEKQFDLEKNIQTLVQLLGLELRVPSS